MRSFFLILFLIHFFISASACDCDTLQKVVPGAHPYQLIFKGRVIDTSSQDAQGIADFLIEKGYLGTNDDTIRIRFDNESSCLMSFAPGEIWLIYAKVDEFRRPQVHFCGHSRRFISNSKDQDHYYQVRQTTFEEEDSILQANFNVIQIELKEEPNLPFRQLEHPERGTAIWYILAALPVLLLLWWLMKRYLK